MDALDKLKDGNRRYVAGQAEAPGRDAASMRESTADGQSPFAIILGCADSRVPPELIFDQSIGDLFVVRVAGNVVTPTQIGSIEYAAENLGSSLIVVLGHSSCGAVKGTMDIVAADQKVTPGLQSLVDLIKPAVESFIPERDSAEAVSGAVAANARASAEALQAQSELIRGLVDQGRISIVSAVYDLASGEVAFLD